MENTYKTSSMKYAFHQILSKSFVQINPLSLSKSFAQIISLVSSHNERDMLHLILQPRQVLQHLQIHLVLLL